MQPFDSVKYIAAQTDEIKRRIDKFPKGKLYFEIGGKFLNDEHASRVLPGFNPQTKIQILQSFKKNFDLIFCINSPDIHAKRIWKSGETYQESVLKKLDEIVNLGLPKPKISINLYNGETETDLFVKKLHELGYDTYYRYFIEDYPNNFDKVLSDSGYGRDQYIPTDSNFVVVIGLGSNTGKMSTCLGQIYHDKIKGLDSGYAKYETFPIWNLPLKHPVNIAYEAATADIGDYNLMDHFHQEAYKEESVNYNRDVLAFPILRGLINSIVDSENYMQTYKSPTDMGVNMAKIGIEDESAVIKASIQEIKNRIDRYKQEHEIGKGQISWVKRCEKLLEEAINYKK